MPLSTFDKKEKKKKNKGFVHELRPFPIYKVTFLYT